MTAVAVVMPLWLLHMRPLQHWLHGWIPKWAWRRGTLRDGITLVCRCLFRFWLDPVSLRAGVLCSYL